MYILWRAFAARHLGGMMSLHVDQMAMSSYIAATNRHTGALERHSWQIQKHTESQDAHRLSMIRTGDLILEFTETVRKLERASAKLAKAMAAYTRAVKAERGE